MMPSAIESERKVARVVAYVAATLFLSIFGLQAWALN
jgi:hypothetical protein